MFCPKCGGQNPENGKFCRTCGTDLGNVTSALSAPQPTQRLVDRKGKPVHWEGAITKIGTGLAFLIISIVLSTTHMGQDWWFWMLIPAFTSLGVGIAQFVQLKKAEKGTISYSTLPESLPQAQNTALPPQQAQWAAPESRYKTGDLTPPSVTEGTTRHLEIDSEGRTMTLPKK